MQQQQLLVQMNQILLDGLRSLNEKLSTSPQEPAEIASTATATATTAVEPEKAPPAAASRKRKTGPKSDSSWICFVKERSQSVKLTPGEKLMTVLAAEWKNMTDDQKEPFVAAAVASKAAKTAIVDEKL